MAPQKLQAGSDMPRITLPKVGGGEVSTEAGEGWKMVVVYRGKHCPICKTYLKTLDGLLDDFKKIDTDVIAISGDPREKAETESRRRTGASTPATISRPTRCARWASTSPSRVRPRKPIGRSPSPACS